MLSAQFIVWIILAFVILLSIFKSLVLYLNILNLSSQWRYFILQIRSVVYTSNSHIIIIVVLLIILLVIITTMGFEVIRINFPKLHSTTSLLRLYLLILRLHLKGRLVSLATIGIYILYLHIRRLIIVLL
jgi:hypothetical protein